MKTTQMSFAARLLSVSLLLYFVPLVDAGVIIGAGAPGNNRFPFGSKGSGPSTRYQQVYSAGEFAGPINIGGVKFFKDSFPGSDYPSNFAIGTYHFEFSVTSKQVDLLDTVDFDDNVTGTILGTGLLELTGGPSSDLLISTSSFLYDPADGNLLMDIKIPRGVTTSGRVPFVAFFDAYEDYLYPQTNGIFSIAENFSSDPNDPNDIGASVGYGLKTEFMIAETASVPEPTSLAIWSFAALGGASLFRRRIR